MALGTVTTKKVSVAGDLRRVVADVVLDSSYPTGGSALSAADLGFKGGTIQLLDASSSGGHVLSYDYANSKLKAFWTGAGLSAVLAEVTAATNMSTFTARVHALISGV